MKQIDFYFDPISPYAYLAFEQLPHALQGLSYSVRYRPVLFAAMLKHFCQLGPAEIPPKRTWTYRQIYWLARQQGVNLQFPAAHPFNPLALLRLGIACGEGGVCNRFVTETLFRYVWQGGLDASDARRLQTLTQQLAPRHDPQDAAVKAQLQSNTQTAIEQGVFGVPMMLVDEQQFWGQDALPLLRAYLEGDAWFAGPQWTQVAQWPTGQTRNHEARSTSAR